MGKLHPLTYSALNTLAELYNDTAQYSKAYETYKEVLSIHREIARNSRTGQAGPEVAQALVHLAEIDEIQAVMEEDEEDSTPEEMEKRRNAAPEKLEVGAAIVDPKILAEREAKAKAVRNEKRAALFKKAYVLYAEALQVFKDFYGLQHEMCASCYAAMGGLRDQQGLFGQAIVLYKQSLDIRQAVHDEACKYLGVANDDYGKSPPHPGLCESYSRLGEILMDMGDLKAARPILEKAVHICGVLAHDEGNHRLTNGRENAFMALATAETALAYCYLQQGGIRNYQKCAPPTEECVRDKNETRRSEGS